MLFSMHSLHQKRTKRYIKMGRNEQKTNGYEPLALHRVCSRHFVQDSNVPELFQWNNNREYDPHRSLTLIVKRNSDLNAGEVPEVDVKNSHEPDVESLVITNEQGLYIQLIITYIRK